MTDTFAFDVFLSHSPKDKPAVRELAERLKQDGLRVWFDEWQIRLGDKAATKTRKIEEGLQNSRTLVLVMSPNAFASDWATLERHTLLFRDPANQDRRSMRGNPPKARKPPTNSERNLRPHYPTGRKRGL